MPVTDITDHELSKIYDDSGSYLEGVCVGYPLDGIELRIISISDKALYSFEEINVLHKNEIGEITINGPNVTEAYLSNPIANAQSKIRDGKTLKIWHRTGDLGRMDREGRLWFYGRKSQRVETDKNSYLTIPVEAVFNKHPCVSRSALVGIERGNGEGKIPVICIELGKCKKSKIYLQEELKLMASEHEMTEEINNFLFHRKFPVDPRHNAKIFREKLSIWAKYKMKL